MFIDEMGIRLMHGLSFSVDRVLFYMPWVHFPIYWYGLFFALGVYVAQKKLQLSLFKTFSLSKDKVHNWIFYWVVFIILGARLGDIVFYQDFMAYLRKPLQILNMREGGLASHGGVLGFLIGFFIGARRLKLKAMVLLEMMIVPATILAFFIRIGNFFNQEILGKATNGPFSVVFTSPLEGGAIVPRHPVQLYEAFSYLLIGAFFHFRKNKEPKSNVAFALMSIFTCRFFLEFLKERPVITPLGLKMGQCLSLPFILAGFLTYISYQRDLKERIQGQL